MRYLAIHDHLLLPKVNNDVIHISTNSAVPRPAVGKTPGVQSYLSVQQRVLYIYLLYYQKPIVNPFVT